MLKSFSVPCLNYKSVQSSPLWLLSINEAAAFRNTRVERSLRSLPPQSVVIKAFLANTIFPHWAKLKARTLCWTSIKTKMFEGSTNHTCVVGTSSGKKDTSLSPAVLNIFTQLKLFRHWWRSDTNHTMLWQSHTGKIKMIRSAKYILG